MSDLQFLVEITSKQQVAEDIFEFEFRSVEGVELPVPSPGSHLDVCVSPELTRQYSLTNGPDETGFYKIAVLREAEGRGGSRQLCDNYQQGDQIRVGAPRNLFPLEPAEELLFVAGGIGITPIYSMIKQSVKENNSFKFYYLTRQQSRAAYVAELDKLCGKDMYVHADAEADQRFDLDAMLASPNAGKHLYVCGPEGLIRAIEEKAAAAGWLAGNIHYELFSRSDSLVHDSDQSFELRISDTDQVITVGADETALEALQRCGLEVPFSCEQGVCGSCLMSVEEGLPDHRDMFLTDAEREANNSFTPCCSRANTPSLTVKLPA